MKVKIVRKGFWPLTRSRRSPDDKDKIRAGFPSLPSPPPLQKTGYSTYLTGDWPGTEVLTVPYSQALQVPKVQYLISKSQSPNRPNHPSRQSGFRPLGFWTMGFGFWLSGVRSFEP